MGNEVELSPCPFCGKPPVLTNVRMSNHTFRVGCYNEHCGVRPATDYYGSREQPSSAQEVIEAWNTRASTTSPLTPEEAKERAAAIVELAYHDKAGQHVGYKERRMIELIASELMAVTPSPSVPSMQQPLDTPSELLSLLGLSGFDVSAEAELSATETDEVFDEVSRRMDAVVDAAVTWRTSDDVWSDDLEKAVDSLLELRASPETRGVENG